MQWVRESWGQLIGEETVPIKFRIIEPNLNFTYRCESRLVSASNTPYRMDVRAFPDKFPLKKGAI